MTPHEAPPVMPTPHYAAFRVCAGLLLLMPFWTAVASGSPSGPDHRLYQDDAPGLRSAADRALFLPPAPRYPPNNPSTSFSSIRHLPPLSSPLLPYYPRFSSSPLPLAETSQYQYTEGDGLYKSPGGEASDQLEVLTSSADDDRPPVAVGPEEMRLLRAILRVFPLAYEGDAWRLRALSDGYTLGGTALQDATDQPKAVEAEEEDSDDPSLHMQTHKRAINTNNINDKKRNSTSNNNNMQPAQQQQQQQQDIMYDLLQDPKYELKPVPSARQAEQLEQLQQLEEPVEKRGLYDTFAGVRNWWGNSQAVRHRPKVDRRAPESKHYSCLKNCILSGKLHPIQCHTLC